MVDFSVIQVPAGSLAWPPGEQHGFNGVSRPPLTAVGNLGVLPSKKLALFCSVRCPGAIIVQAYDLARNLRDAGITVIGGFQSPMEKECLELLLRGRQPVIVCPARGLDGMRLPAAWRAAVKEGRLLLLSPFAANVQRPTAELAQARNELVAAVADVVFIAHAAPGGKTEAFARVVLGWGKRVLTLDSPENAGLVTLGATSFRPAQVANVLKL